MALENQGSRYDRKDRHEHKVLWLIFSCHILKHVFYLYNDITNRLIRFFLLGDYDTNSIWPLSTDHAPHSGLFHAPWNLIARLVHGTVRGWYSHKKQRVESAEQSQSPLFPEVALSGQEVSILFEQCGGSWGLTSPTQAIGTFPQAGSLQEVTTLSCAIQPDTVFVMGVVLKWILCICHQCRNIDLRAIINTCENPQLLVIFNNLFRFNLESNVK